MVAALSSLLIAAARSWPARTWKKPASACAVTSEGLRCERSWKYRLPSASARAATSAVARTTNVLGCAPGQAAASFSDSRKRLGEIGLIIGISLL